MKPSKPTQSGRWCRRNSSPRAARDEALHVRPGIASPAPRTDSCKGGNAAIASVALAREEADDGLPALIERAREAYGASRRVPLEQRLEYGYRVVIEVADTGFDCERPQLFVAQVRRRFEAPFVRVFNSTSEGSIKKDARQELRSIWRPEVLESCRVDVHAVRVREVSDDPLGARVDLGTDHKESVVAVQRLG